MSRKIQTSSQSNTPNPGGKPTVSYVGSSVAPTYVEEMLTAISQVVAYSAPPDMGVSSPQASIASAFSRELQNFGTRVFLI